MRFSLPLLFFWGLQSFAASEMHPHAELFKSATESHVTVTRYAGHPDFHSQRSLLWKFNEAGLLVDTYRAHARVSIGDCETLMGAQQKFALEKMAGTGYLNAADVPMYIRMSETLDPAQINFVQRSRTISRADAIAAFGDQWKVAARTNELVESDPWAPTVPIVTATTWSVGGQTLDPFTRTARFRELPWQKDPERKELAAAFDRDKYNIVFEWGRTAQDLPREVEPLGSVLAAINVQEVLALGADIDDAWVMFHSFDEVNTRAYSMRFPNSLYPQGWTNKKDALFLVPLRKVIEVFPPSKASQRVHDLIGASGGRLDEISALDWLLKFRRADFTLLDVKAPPNAAGVPWLPRPLAIRDRTEVGAYRRAMLALDYGFKPDDLELDAMARILVELPGAQPSWNSGQFTDLADLDVSYPFYQDNRAIEISNLDRGAATFDPDYVARTLIGVFIWYIKSVDPSTLQSDARILEVVRSIRGAYIKFGFTTFDPMLMARIRHLGPVKEHRYEYDKDFEGRPEFPGQEWLSMGYEQEPYAFLFEVDQILKLIEARPDLYAEAMNAVIEDQWARHLMLANPDVL